MAVLERVLELYREKYFDFNLRHFHEKLASEHPIGLSYSWVKGVLQGAGLVARGRQRGVHRKRRAAALAGDAAAYQWQPPPVVSGRTAHRGQQENQLSLVLAAFRKLVAVIEAGRDSCPRQTIKGRVSFFVTLMGIGKNIAQIHSSLIPNAVICHGSGFEQFDEERS